ncbi:MAG TPA: cytochrome c, partial [Ramlibacter sp.]
MNVRRIGLALSMLVLLLAAATAWVAWRNLQVEDETSASAAPAAAISVERGAYLARIGNCATCHTARGGAAYAGGRGIATPFGTVYAGNLTPDPETGLGRWSASDFWRALHDGRSREGRLLYPAFPYPDFTHVTRQD